MKRDLTIDRREKCSCCGNHLLKCEKIFRCEDYATEPNIFATEGYKYNGHQVVDFSKAVYCSNCIAKFEQVLSRIRKKCTGMTHHEKIVNNRKSFVHHRVFSAWLVWKCPCYFKSLRTI